MKTRGGSRLRKSLMQRHGGTGKYGNLGNIGSLLLLGEGEKEREKTGRGIGRGKNTES